MKKILIAFITIVFFGSCATTKINSNKRKLIEVAINLNNVVDDKVQVEVNPQKIKENTIVYQIPAIVPGTYAKSDYGKFISDFKAFDYNGNEIATTKLDTNSWQINNAKKMDKITYWVDDTFDSEKEHNIYVMAGTNIEEGKNFFLNLPGFVGYFKGKKESPYNLSIKHPADLYETSSLINKNTTKETNTEDIFFASRYDEISDNPIMYAPLNTVNFTVGGVNVSLAVYSPNNVHAASDMEEDLKKMVLAQTNFLEGFKTTNEYNILLYLFDPEVYKWQSFGALEHLSSTTVVYPETYSKQQLANGMINGTVSHEFFHIVTPLSVHSEEIHSFNFNTPNMSKHLWMYEGITEYFANLFQVNQGLITEQQFIDEMKGKIASSLRYNDTMSFTKMSKNILEDEYAKNYGNVYQKGALIGMCLDILLREESKGAYGVRNLMKDLSDKYGANKPFKDDEILAEIVSMTYPSVGTFFENHLTGNIAINYSEFLNKVGVVKEIETVDASYFLDSQRQLFISANNQQEVFFTDRKNTALSALGVKPGDILKSVNGEAVTLQSARIVIGKSMQWQEGDALVFEVIRNGETLKLEGNFMKSSTEVEKLIIEDLPDTNPKKKLRDAWLKAL
ncbi:peptidase M61 [Polaribacter litorisediminis]|uniref:M61 family metallopeptidase n=1 Tax=Polaribacter litorisediminis TaxID=1908341 RepID=UPI001CC10201|nr:peptidase M61 [Polaribacter litorisediminis]UAM96862.1 peptidase M61 [Polaribacter litorisediminis]